MKITPINGSDREFTSSRYILSFGAYGCTHLMVWANSLEDALDECIDWIADNAPGLLCDEGISDEYNRLVLGGMGGDEAYEQATVDTTSGGNCGHHIHSFEWALHAENPTRAEILEMQAS